MGDQDDLSDIHEKDEYSLDHRKIGLENNFFYFLEEGGSGFPFWTKNGYKLIEIIRKYVNDFQEKICGIKLVKTPILGHRKLYEATGHLRLYSENIFKSINQSESEEYILRPMSCPHHILLAKREVQGYTQLPYLVGENAILHRYEYSGGLLGLKRVRAMELIDTHIFTLEIHLEKMIEKSLEWIWSLLEKFKIPVHAIILATRGDLIKDNTKSNKYSQNNEYEWEKSEQILFEVAREWASKRKIESKLIKRGGDAAFYGPKLDFNVLDKFSKEFTISTLQLDNYMSQKLDFAVMDSKQNKIYPWIIHLGLIGTLERFIAYLLENTNGRLPFWLSPIQIIIIPLDVQQFSFFAQDLLNRIIQHGFRVEIDLSESTFSRKTMNAYKRNIPIHLFIGEKEVQDLNLITFKILGQKCLNRLYFEEFIGFLKKLKNNR